MKKFQVTVNGNVYEVEVQELGGDFVAAPVVPVAQKVAAPVAQKAAPVVAVPANATKVVAPMPGKIVDVKVKVGQTIKEGDLLAVLEAMKMENEIFASQGGTIASVNVNAGAMVESNDVIVTIN
ncbi:MAG: biotin/lipoyl-containing protein [Cellulosilyticaceae bacterium]